MGFLKNFQNQDTNSDEAKPRGSPLLPEQTSSQNPETIKLRQNNVEPLPFNCDCFIEDSRDIPSPFLLELDFLAETFCESLPKEFPVLGGTETEELLKDLEHPQELYPGSGSGRSSPGVSELHTPTQLHAVQSPYLEDMTLSPGSSPQYQTLSDTITAPPISRPHTSSSQSSPPPFQRPDFTRKVFPFRRVYQMFRPAPRQQSLWRRNIEIPTSPSGSILISAEAWAKAWIEAGGKNGGKDKPLKKAGNALFDHLFSDEEVLNSCVSARAGMESLCPQKREAITTAITWMKHYRNIPNKSPYDFQPLDLAIERLNAEDTKDINDVFIDRRNERKRKLKKVAEKRRREELNEILKVVKHEGGDGPSPRRRRNS